mmetsp:Transcript_40722/g.86776  ORF Transcript_40722/g.86776 Transcript_40722/m.86776 type:complete len:276 (-) Transcript_40722:486-1313(-)
MNEKAPTAASKWLDGWRRCIFRTCCCATCERPIHGREGLPSTLASCASRHTNQACLTSGFTSDRTARVSSNSAHSLSTDANHNLQRRRMAIRRRAQHCMCRAASLVRLNARRASLPRPRRAKKIDARSRLNARRANLPRPNRATTTAATSRLNARRVSLPRTCLCMVIAAPFRLRASRVIIPRKRDSSNTTTACTLRHSWRARRPRPFACTLRAACFALASTRCACRDLARVSISTAAARACWKRNHSRRIRDVDCIRIAAALSAFKSWRARRAM